MPSWKRTRQRFGETWLRNFGTDVGSELLTGVLPVLPVVPDGAGDTFSVSALRSLVGGGGRPATITLWAGDKECILHQVYVRVDSGLPTVGAMAAMAYTPPLDFRFARFNLAQSVGPALGTIHGRGELDDRHRQSNAIIVHGNPGIATDPAPFTQSESPAFPLGAGATGHPLVQTALGSILLIGPIVTQRITSTLAGGWQTTPQRNLLVGPIRLRRFDPLTVTTLDPTLGTLHGFPITYNNVNAWLEVTFVWSELAAPAYPRARNGFVGAF